MANSLLGYSNYVKDAVITADEQAGDLTPNNLRVDDPLLRWRSTGTTPTLSIDLQSNRSIDFLALRFCRDTTSPVSGTLRHRLDAEGGTPGAGAVYDTGNIALGVTEGYDMHVHKPSTAKNARYWQIDFDVTGVTFIDIGIAWASAAHEFDPNIDYGWGDLWRDFSERVTSPVSGKTFVGERPRQRAVNFSSSLLSASDADTLQEIQRVSGLSQQVCFVYDPASDPGRRSLIGKFSTLSPLTEPNVVFRRQSFVIAEDI